MTVLRCASPFLLVLLSACGPADAPAANSWRADPHTHTSIARFERVLADQAPPATATDPAAYTAFGDAMQKEVDALIRGCTMTGPDHDQLHVWLDQLLPLVKKLRQDPSIDARRQAVQQLRSLLQRFHEWFPAG